MKAIVTTCARCGEDMLLSTELVAELDPASVSLVHDVCPRDRRERAFRVAILVSEVPGGDDGRGDELVAGFTVDVAAATLRAAVEKATPLMTEKWTKLYETAHLADADAGPTIQSLLPDDDDEETS